MGFTIVNSALLVILAIIIYVVCYVLYGRKLLERRVVRADPTRLTPAWTRFDGIDYVPANKYVLYGHHFASIAGAGPIVGPAIAMVYGWLPCLIWIWFGNVFIGAVHDYLALMASVRYDGMSIAYITEKIISKRARYIFAIYIYFTLILIAAAFLSVCATVFVNVPGTATQEILFIPLGLLLGMLLYRVGLSIRTTTIIGYVLLWAIVIYAYFIPLKLPYETWIIVMTIYAFLASWLPVWYLLQPRDFIQMLILWTGLIFGTAALIAGFKPIEQAPVLTLVHPMRGPFWPCVPLYIACGALSGFHSLVSSGTSSKQLANELDALLVGYGGMFSEGYLSTIVVTSMAAFWVTGKIEAGLGGFLKAYGLALQYGLGLPAAFGTLWAGIWLTSFVTTTLDTDLRLARYIWVELMEPIKKYATAYKVLANRVVASLIAALLSFALGYPKIYEPTLKAWVPAYKVLWGAFGGMNQLLASLALITTATWIYGVLRAPRGPSLLAFVPAFFLWITVTGALIWWLGWFAPPRIASPSVVGAAIIIGISLALNFALLGEVIASIRRYRKLSS